MKINEVLECLNKAVDNIKERKDIITKDHYVATTEIKRVMGPYKQCTVRIIHVHVDTGNNNVLCIVSNTERCLAEDEEKLIKKTEAQALTEFFEHHLFLS